MKPVNMNEEHFVIIGTKLIEIPYLEFKLSDQSSSDNVLIVGERVATEGILQAVLKKDFNSCLCTDIMPMGVDSTLEKIIKRDSRVSFLQEDFIELDEKQEYDYIICINVLEHFGMNFQEFHGFSGALAGDDYIRWNHDLRAIQKMITLLNDNPKSKIIITVPAGPPVLSGDTTFGENDGNKMPKLRRYDEPRINLIKDMLKESNINIEEKYYYSKDLEEWFESDYTIIQPQYLHLQNSYTPNMIWAFTLNKEINNESN